MALSFSVFNKFKAVDQVSAPMKKMERSVSKFGKTATREFKRSDRAASQFSKTVKGLFVGAGLLTGVALLQQGVSSVTSQFIEFDDAIVAAGARFKDIGPDVENFQQAIEGIKAAARDAGATTEFTAAQAAKGLDFLARTGFKSSVAIGSLTSMINLATASGEEFASVADMSSDLLGAFGLNSDNTAKKIANLNKLNDVLVKTVNSANVTVEDMFETMKTVGPIATGVLGASLEEVSALTGVLANSGLKGSDAMTALKNAYLRLAAPTSEASKLLDRFGISIDDGQGGARKMTDVMADLGKNLSGLGKVEQAAALDVIFGKRAIAGGKNIIDNIKNIKTLEKALLNSAGTSRKTAEIMRMSLGNRLKSLGSAASEFGFKILSAFDVKGKDAITRFTEAVRNIDTAPIVSLIELIVGVAKSTHELFTANKDLIPWMEKLIGLWIGWKIAVAGLNFVLAISNGLLAANPIGLFILALAAVALAIKTSIDNWDEMNLAFSDGLSWMNDKVLKFADGIENIFSGIGDFVENIFSGIGSKVESIMSGAGGKLLNVLGFDDDAQSVNTTAPISPNAGMIASHQEINRNSKVDVNFNNAPAGTEIKRTGKDKSLNLNMGYSGAF